MYFEKHNRLQMIIKIIGAAYGLSWAAYLYCAVCYIDSPSDFQGDFIPFWKGIIVYTEIPALCLIYSIVESIRRENKENNEDSIIV